MYRRAIAVCTGLLLMFNCSCRQDERKPTAPVSGVVTYQGRPLNHGRVVFIHECGQGAASQINSDGRYSLDAVLGKNVVMIECLDTKDTGAASQDLLLPRGDSLIPSRYQDYITSGLTCNVQEGKNTTDFSLTP